MLASRFLDTYSTESLKTIARRRGLAGATTASKAQLITFLGKRLFSREANRRLVQSLPRRQRLLLAALKARGGEAETVALAATVDGEATDVAADIHLLVELGLFLYPREGRSRKYRVGECERVWMDRTAADAIDPADAVGSIPKLIVSPPARAREADPGLLLADLLLFLNHLERHSFAPPGPDPVSHDWPGLSRSLLVPATFEPEKALEQTGRLYFIYLLLEETGLLKVRGGRLAPARKAGHFFHQDHAEREKEIFSAWSRLWQWNEFARIHELLPRSLPDKNATDDTPSPGRVLRARARVLSCLKRFDPNRWYAFSSLLRELKSRYPEFLIRRDEDDTVARHTYRGFGQRGRNDSVHALDLTADWDRVEGRFIARVLLEPMHWLGAVDLGFENGSAPDSSRLDAFRITAAGAYLLGLSDASPGSGGNGGLVIQPDFDVLLLDGTPDTGLLHDLSRFATFTGGDRVVRFHLTRQSVQAGFRDGWSRERILKLLEVNAAAPVPQNITASLVDWETSFQRFRIVSGVTLLEVPEETLSSLAPQVRLDLGKELGAGIWEPDTAALPRLRRAFQRRKITLQQFDYACQNGHGLRLGPGLEIRQHQRGGDWVTSSLLSRVAVSPIKAGVWLLDRAQVKNALQDGFSVDEIIQNLESRSATPAPEMRLAINAWAGHFDRVRLGQETVFTCEDRRLLSLIMETPSLSSLVTEKVGPYSFIIRKGAIKEFRQTLDRLGVRSSGHRHSRPLMGPLASHTQEQSPPATGTIPFRWSRRDQAQGLAGQVRHQEQLSFLLSRAVESRRKIRVDYFTSNPRRTVQRELSPLLLDGASLVAFCHQKRSEQTFHLDHIVTVELLPERY